MRSFQKLWLFCGCLLVFLSSCTEGSVAGIGPSEVSEQRHEEEASEKRKQEEAQAGIRVEGVPVVSTKDREVVSWRSAPKAENTTAFAFKPLSAPAAKAFYEKEAQEMHGNPFKPIKIGTGRDAEAECALGCESAQSLNWQSTGDGHTARLTITSPKAQGMRVGLQLNALPDHAELRFSGSGSPKRILGVVRGKEAKAVRAKNNVYWTPVTDGETQNIEIYLPSASKTEEVEIRLDGASHLFGSAQERFRAASAMSALEDYIEHVLEGRLGTSLPCNVDLACKAEVLDAAFQNASKSVALMLFTDPVARVTSVGCSGTLVNDAISSQTPYFWSAAHCFSNDNVPPAAVQEIANNLNTFWFYEAAQCNQPPASVADIPFEQLVGGAEVLHNSIVTNTSLIRLYDTPPSGALFSGFDSTRFLSGAFMGIHHPQVELKKVSTGNGEGRTCDTHFSGSDPSTPEMDLTTLTLVSFSEGLVEAGSSGSGLFTLSDGLYFLRGGLSGAAPITCADIGHPVDSGDNAACYSSLHMVWDELKQWLDPAVAPAAPVLSNESLSNITAASAQWSVTSDQDAQAHWVVRRAHEPAPTAAEIVAEAGANTGAMTANTAFVQTLSGLSSRTAYRLHFVASNNGLFSTVWSEAFTTLPLPIVDVPTGVDGRILSPAQTGDSVHWVEIARNGNYALIVRSEFINIYPHSKSVWGNPAWQYTGFGTTNRYMTAQNSVRWKLNDWFNGTAQGEAEKLPANARMRDFVVQTNLSQAIGTSAWSPSLHDGFTKPTPFQVGIGDDIAFALSYGEAANFLSLLHFLRGMYIANQPSSDIAQANFAKISIPVSNPYTGMWLRSPGDVANTAAFMSSHANAMGHGRVFQEFITDVRGLLYPAVWVDEEIF